MSDRDADASNAIIAVAKFYSEALARVTAERDQLVTMVKRVGSVPVGWDVDHERDAVVEMALQYVAEDTGARFKMLRLAVEAYARTRPKGTSMGRVVPDPAREGAVRGAPADGPPDVSG